MKKSILILIFCILGILCITTRSYAQDEVCIISGQIVDAKNAPVAYAAVAVYNGKAPVSGMITDNDGKFSLKIKQGKGELALTIEFIGFSKHTQTIIPDMPHLNVGSIVLKEDSIALEGATVTAKEAIQKSTVEHTTINASANMTSSKGTALDILRSASSVDISNDRISIRGNSNILILIDGIPTTTSDLTTISAGNIKSIEVITNPDASHDASGTGGIINIISKKTSAEGFSGILAANYGFNHFVTANAAFTYNTSKASFRFNYNTRYEDDQITTSLQREVKSNGHKVNQLIDATKYVYNNNITLGTDIRLNNRNRLSIDVKCIIPRNNLVQDLRNSFNADGNSTVENRHNDVTWNRENIEGSIGYTHIIKPEISDISVKGSISKIWGHRPSSYYIDGNMTSRSNSGGSPFISSLQADYKYKSKAGMISAGAKLTYRRNDIFHQFYNLTGDEWVYSDALSNDLIHSELVPAAYAMFSSRIGKKFTYKAGLRGEMSWVTLDSSHDNVNKGNASFFLAPSLSGTYKITESQELSLALSRRVGRPTYPQLNPYMSMVDATTYEKGNMFLRPEKASKLDLSYTLKRGVLNLFVNGYLNHTTDYISQITMIDEADRLITTYANTDSDLKTGLDLSLRIKPTKWINISLAANTYYVSTRGSFDGAEISNSGITNNSNIMLDFLPWKGGDIQCQYFVTTPQYFPQLTAALTHQMNIGIRQKFLKGSLTVSLLLTDVFDTEKWEVTSRNNIFNLSNISNNKSRMLWLGISYNFNSFKQKSAQKKETDRSLIKLGL